MSTNPCITPLQMVLDKFYFFRKAFVTTIAYLSVRLYGSEVKWCDLWNEKFRTYTHIDRDLSNVGDIDTVLSEAKERLNHANTRRETISDKCKTLLTLASFLVALVGATLAKASLGPTWMRILFFLSMLALLNAVTLVAVVLAARSEMTIDIEQHEVNLQSNDLKKCLTNLYLRCQTDRDNQNDYLVEIYKVARFFFLSALTVLVVVSSVNFLIVSPDAQAKAVARELKTDTTFIQSIRREAEKRGEKEETSLKGLPSEITP